MVRAPCCEKMGLKKGPWSPEEDQILISYIQLHGHGNWRALPKQAGLLRCGKSCRLRWTNYLRPDIKRGNFSKEEEETIISLHQMLGNRWSAIAARLPGRTDNEIKNVWHTHLKKKLKNNYDHKSSSQDSKIRHVVLNVNVTSPEQSSSTEISSVTDTSATEKMAVKIEEMDYSSSEYFPQIDESFWSDELLSKDDQDAVNCSNNEEKNEKKDQDHQLQFMGNHEEEEDSRSDDSMDFWYNLFIRAGDMPDLPEF